jgi:hypothetical protein
MRRAAIILAAVLMLASAGRATAAEILPVGQLPPLPVSFWTALDSEANAEIVRSAYLRGFIEATRLWGHMKDSGQGAALGYLRLIQGMNLLQLSNLVRRVAEENPQLKDKMALTEAVTACVIRARTGQPLIDKKPAKPPAAPTPQAPAK